MNDYLITYRCTASNVLHSTIEVWDKISAKNINNFERIDGTISKVILNIIKLDK